VVGPLIAASDSSGCQPRNGCSFDYVLAPNATHKGSVSWHALWTTTPPTGKAATGFCTTNAIALLSWGTPGPSDPSPTRTFPPVGQSAVTSGMAASLLVDAGGDASPPGRLSQRTSWPAGLVTTVAHNGWMSVLWQGRTTGGVALALAAEIAAPSPTLQAGAGATNSDSLGVPCADVAPPGTTFLARLEPATAHRSQPSWLELRIPATGLIWKTPSEQTAIYGKATVAITTLANPTTNAKPQTQLFADRISLKFPNPYPGRYLVRVTLNGPTGTRKYQLPLTVR
jgi:hypothetical protein